MEQKKQYVNSINLKNNTSFPYLVLDVINDTSSPLNAGFNVMHWHEDLQFIYVLSGKIDIVTLETTTVVYEGEGAFLNKNVVHMIKRGSPCHYNSFIFPDYFLKFYDGCPANEAVVRIVENKNLPICHIENRNQNHKIISLLRKLSIIEKNKTDLYEYEVLSSLCTLWLEFCHITALQKSAIRKTIQEERMTMFLRFISEHFSEPISLEELAQSANVSKTECLRCFKSLLKKAPYQYLMEYRLSKAIEMLEDTNNSIGEIAIDTGFCQSSHFGKCFKEKIGLSPKAFRKNNEK